MKLTPLPKEEQLNYDGDSLIYISDTEFAYNHLILKSVVDDIQQKEMMVYGGYYKFEKGDDSPRIYLLCQGKRSGKFKLKIQNFYPYCFKYTDDGDSKTYLGKSCEKFVLKGQHPANVKFLREGLKSRGYPQALEADILFCLKKGTMISLNNEYKNIENCVIGEEILSSNETTLKQDSAKITDIRKKQVDKYLKIKTQLSTIECDENHRIPILDSTGDIKIKLAKDILNTDFLLASEFVGKFGDGYDLKINHNDSLYGSQLKLKEGIVDDDFFELYGYYTGDGVRVLHKSLSIKDREYDNILYYSNIFRKYTGTKSVPRRIEKENSYVFEVTCKSLSEIFKEYKLNLLTANVHIDERFIKNCDKYQVSSILRGLFDAEGHVADEAITFTSISKQLVNQVGLLLKRYGIFSNIIKSKHMSSDGEHIMKDVYMLTISECHSINRFKFHINFNDKQKKQSLDDIDSKKNRFYYVYPFGDILKEIKKSLNLHHNYWNGYNFKLDDWTNDKHHISYYSLIKIIDGFKEWIYDKNINNARANELINKLEDILFRKNIVPIKIKSIEIINEPTILYDISLDKDYMFYANGLITHNCRRFLIDTYDYFKPKEKINPTYAIVDIETDFPVSDDIISFAINNPDGDIYYESKYDTPDKDELALSLYEKLQEFDVVLAWMGEDSFDLKIMDKAFKKIDKPPLTESVVVLDLIEISRKMHGREIRGNWSLDNAGKRLCGIAKSLDEEDMKLDVRELSEEKLQIYNIIDTIIPEVIDNHLGGLEGHVILAWSLQSMLEDMVIVAAVNDIALLRAYHRAGIVLPSREFTKGKSNKATYEAAKPDARQGVYEDIVVLDLIHAYPSAVIAGNISPETKDENGIHLTPKGTRFNDGKSVFIDTLKELMVERAKIKKQLKKLDKDDSEYKKLKSIDFAIKTLVAAFSHGIFGWANSRMKDVETADAITAVVREIINKVKETCDIIGKRWCYCHTDSAYIICKKEEAETTVNYINGVIKEFCKGYNVTPELEFKGYYRIGYIHSPARNVLVPEGVEIDDDENWEESGMDFARSETAEPIAQIEIELLKMKLKYQDEKMIEQLKEMIKELPDKTSQELALIKPLNKKVSEYGKPKLDGTIGGIPFHIKAMQRAHEEYGLELKLKEKYGILPIITNETEGVRVKRRKRVDMAFLVDEGLPKNYLIDYEIYLKTNLFGKINDLFGLKVKELENLILDEEVKQKLGIG